MKRITFINLIIIITASDIQDSDIERKINITLETKNISDAALLLDLQTFVSYNGLRKDPREAGPNKPDLRMRAKYYLPKDVEIQPHILDLMRQQVYSTQEKMMNLEPILKKYENNPAFRMAFIYNRLRQLIIDLRRLYTLSNAHKNSKDHPVFLHIFWYSHIVRKYFDVIYIVEHVIKLFADMKKQLTGNE